MKKNLIGWPRLSAPACRTCDDLRSLIPYLIAPSPNGKTSLPLQVSLRALGSRNADALRLALKHLTRRASSITGPRSTRPGAWRQDLVLRPAPKKTLDRIIDVGLLSHDKHRYIVHLTESELDLAKRMAATAELYAISVIRKEQEKAQE